MIFSSVPVEFSCAKTLKEIIKDSIVSIVFLPINPIIIRKCNKIYGFTTNFDYKRFTLSLYFYGSYGNDIFNANLLQQENTYSSTNVRKDSYYQAWSEDNPGNIYPRLGFRLREPSDRQVEDGSFLRLGSITLGYRLPIGHGSFIRNLSISVTGRNLFTLTEYKGYSPDVNSFAADPMRIGIDWGGYPSTRSFAFGVNMAF